MFEITALVHFFMFARVKHINFIAVILHTVSVHLSSRYP